MSNAGSDFHTLAGRLVYPWVGITQYCRAVTQTVVDILIAVDIPKPPTPATLDVNGLVFPPVTKI